MEIFLYNFHYLLFNTFLALISIWFGYLMLKPFPPLIRFFCGFIWLIFLPNTLYLFTDITHLPEDWTRVDFIFKLILTGQFFLFAVIGIVTFVIATYFFQRLLDGKNKRMQPATIVAIILLNFLVGFGVILGGIQRTHSWYIFTDPIRVIGDVIDVIISKELLVLSFGFGILANIIYFLLVKKVAKWNKKLF